MFHALPRWTNKNLDEQNREKDYSISLSFVWSQRTATPLPPQAVTMAAVSSMVSRRPSGSELAAHAASSVKACPDTNPRYGSATTIAKARYLFLE